MTLSFSVDVDAFATSRRMSRPDAGFAMRPIGAGTGADPTGRRPKVRDVLCAVGDLVEDIVVWLSGPPGVGTDVDVTVFRRRGGSAANVAALAAANGTPARFVGQVGEDDLGARLIADARHRRRRGASAPRRPHRHHRRARLRGRANARCSPIGAPPCCSARPTTTWLDGVTVLHLPAYSLTVGRLAETAAHLARRAKARGILVSIDASSVAVLASYGVGALPSLLLELAPDVLLANQDEARLLGRRRTAPPTVSSSSWCMPARGPAIAADGDGARASVRARHRPRGAATRPAPGTRSPRASCPRSNGAMPSKRRSPQVTDARRARSTLPGASVGAVVR